MMWTGMAGWGGGLGFALGHLLFWGLLVVAVLAVARWVAGGHRLRDGDAPDRALEILKERYARGEIDKAEFDSRRRDLA